MTPLVRETMRFVADSLDPTEMHWFDASGCFADQSEESQTPLLESRPPFAKCMVCWEGRSRSYERMRMYLLIVGDDPSQGVVLTVWRQALDQPPVASPVMVYLVDDEQIRYGPVDEDVTMDKTEAEMILGFVSAWYASLSRRAEAYVPVVADTWTNRRKIAQNKVPRYEWRTVVVKPSEARRRPQGGTHASPRLHDRRGHIRRLSSGKNVWVKSCRVGDASRGVVFHDYKVAPND